MICVSGLLITSASDLSVHSRLNFSKNPNLTGLTAADSDFFLRVRRCLTASPSAAIVITIGTSRNMPGVHSVGFQVEMD